MKVKEYVVIASLLYYLIFSITILNAQSGGVQTSSGVKLLSMSQVSIAYNPTNTSGYSYPGSWWLATALVGGQDNINVNQPASAFNPGNASYVCNETCQNNNLQIATTNNKILYPVSSQGTQVDSYTISFLGNHNPVQLSYQTCINGPLFGTSGMPTAMNLSNLYVNFGGCVNTAAENQSYVNYYTACKNQGGNSLIYYSGTGSLFNWGGTNYFIQLGSTVGCFQLNSNPVAYVYQLSGGQVNQTVSVTLNGQTETVSSSHQINNTLQNMAIYYLNFQPGSLESNLPSSTGAVILDIANSTLANKIGVQQNTALLQGQVLQSQISSNLAQTKSDFQKAVTYSNASYYLNSQTSAEFGLFVNNNPNTQFNGATTVGQQSGVGGFTALPTYVEINDPNSMYATAQVQLLIQAKSLGLYLGVAKFNITSSSLPNFRSGSTGTLTLNIKNTGTATGGYTISVSSGSSAVSISPPSVTGSLNVNQTTSAQFTIGDNEQNIPSNSNISRSLSATVCNTASSPQCQTANISFGVGNPCQNNEPFNAGNCQTLTTIAPPTTTSIVPPNQQNTVQVANQTSSVSSNGNYNSNNKSIVSALACSDLVSSAFSSMSIPGLVIDYGVNLIFGC